MANRTTPQQLAKLLHYVLGRSPDEFALVPDSQGFVPLKELLKALAEEPGWRHVRRGMIQEVRLVVPDCPLEWEGDRIRATDRARLPQRATAQEVPALLYIAVRRRAHAAALEKGLAAPPEGELVMADNEALASRLGRRRDAEPVMLTVHTGRDPARMDGLERYGGHLFLCRSVDAALLTGPALPREREEKSGKKKPDPLSVPKTPGSFIMESLDPILPHSRDRSRKKGKKNTRRKPPPWRE